jgi:phospholipid/cholesterol/gamma-HCH transport system substrate-binding protein
MAALLASFAGFTYLSYNAAFTATDTITVTSPRAGLVMDRDAKVKYRGIQIGKVKAIAFSDDEAQLTLAIDSKQLRFVPSNVDVRIAGSTIFGAKSVEFVPPDLPSASALLPGAHVAASSVSVEANTLFQTLMDVLHEIDPVELNASLTALADGLRGRGDDAGVLLAQANQLLAQLNPTLPTLQTDLQQVAKVANDYADAGPALIAALGDVPTISRTIVDQQDNLNRTLLAATGLGHNAYDTLAPAADNYVAAIQRLRAPTQVLSDYSPEFGCLIKGMAVGVQRFAPLFSGAKPGIFQDSFLLPGAPAYTYPESLPIVNASGGPNCRGLPDVPTKQFGGSWYRTPFLVTDNAYIPFEPNTEMQVDAPSTLQFLFNGAYAERDDF